MNDVPPENYEYRMLRRETDYFTGNIMEEGITNTYERIRRVFSPEGDLISIDKFPIYADPEMIEITRIGDTERSYIQSLNPKICTDTLIESDKYTLTKKEADTVNIKLATSVDGAYTMIYCSDEKDLSVDRILTTISAMKGRLMLHIGTTTKEIVCYVTPQTKKNIIEASKKLKMYGKKRPIIARFDEYGNRLPDTIEIGTNNGITLKIINPERVFSELYFELKIEKFSNAESLNNTIDYYDSISKKYHDGFFI